MIPTGFYSIGDALSCLSYSWGCVDSDLCPQPAPLNCPEGTMAQYVTKGFYEIGNGLSCPDMEAQRVSPALDCIN